MPRQCRRLNQKTLTGILLTALKSFFSGIQTVIEHQLRQLQSIMLRRDSIRRCSIVPDIAVARYGTASGLHAYLPASGQGTPSTARPLVPRTRRNVDVHLQTAPRHRHQPPSCQHLVGNAKPAATNSLIPPSGIDHALMEGKPHGAFSVYSG